MCSAGGGRREEGQMNCKEAVAGRSESMSGGGEGGGLEAGLRKALCASDPPTT